jgi:hypothetical protein
MAVLPLLEENVAVPEVLRLCFGGDPQNNCQGLITWGRQPGMLKNQGKVDLMGRGHIHTFGISPAIASIEFIVAQPALDGSGRDWR